MLSVFPADHDLGGKKIRNTHSTSETEKIARAHLQLSSTCTVAIQVVLNGSSSIHSLVSISPQLLVVGLQLLMGLTQLVLGFCGCGQLLLQITCFCAEVLVLYLQGLVFLQTNVEVMCRRAQFGSHPNSISGTLKKRPRDSTSSYRAVNRVT